MRLVLLLVARNSELKTLWLLGLPLATFGRPNKSPVCEAVQKESERARKFNKLAGTALPY